MAQSSSAKALAPDNVLEFVRTFEAPPALVFRMWSEVEHLVRWHGPEGLWLTHCEQDFSEGGAWRRCMSHGPGHAHWIHGVYREIRPFTRLSFTYVNEYDPFETLVEMDFRDLGGRTEMRFRQAPFPTVEERDGHGWGWRSGFGLLAEYLLQFEGIEQPPKGRPRIEGVAADIVAARQRQTQSAERRPVAAGDEGAHQLR